MLEIAIDTILYSAVYTFHTAITTPPLGPATGLMLPSTSSTSTTASALVTLLFFLRPDEGPGTCDFLVFNISIISVQTQRVQACSTKGVAE